MTAEERLARAKAKQEVEDGIACDGLIYTIVPIHRRRMFMQDQRIRCEHALGAYLRRAEGWTKNKPEAERKAIAARVAAMMDGSIDPGDHAEIIKVSRQGSLAFILKENQETWKLEYVTKKLPVWQSWAKDVKGFGARSLGGLIGEAGDLSNYPDHSKLWKRMGLATMDGAYAETKAGGVIALSGRQGGLPKNASKEEWTAHGYNRDRRSAMFVIGECLWKASGKYRDIYLARKEYERERATASGLVVLPAARIPKKDREGYMSDGHIHRRAQRYMEKRFLRDLWKAWRGGTKMLHVNANNLVPSAEDFADEAATGAKVALPSGQTIRAPVESFAA